MADKPRDVAEKEVEWKLETRKRPSPSPAENKRAVDDICKKKTIKQYIKGLSFLDFFSKDNLKGSDFMIGFKCVRNNASNVINCKRCYK